ncbi:MAG: DNA primase [Rickettsiales bacterium]|nr:DNA primase [Rickettsiales bacterium]
MLFSKDFPEKLRSTILVSEVVGKKVKLKLRGKEFIGLCPFHNEKSPSFTVNDQKGFYHCFGCSAHGDVISFVMQNEALDYKDAVNKLAQDFSIPIPQLKFDESEQKQLTRDLLLLENIATFFEKNLREQNGQEALFYLNKRGISADNIKKFRLGFAPNSYEALTKFLQAQGFSDQEISACGVIAKNDQQKFYDKFRHRIIFPITNKKGQIIAFGGRTIKDDLPKYLNSAETAVFKKNQTLYNFHFARKAIFAKGYAVVVEGYMDAISLFTNGIENVVAGLGTALGIEHLKELFFTTDKIIICLDGDEAGIRAAKRVCEIVLPLISAKKNINFAFLPNQLDPDDFIKKFGAKELEKVFADSIPLSQSLFDFALKEFGIDKQKKISAEIKAKIEANLTAKITAIQDQSLKKYFTYFFKDALFNLGKNSAKNSTKITENFSKKNFNKIGVNSSKTLAKAIIALIIKYPQLINFSDEIFNLKETQFLDEEITNLKDEISALIEEDPKINSEKLIKALENSLGNNDVKDLKNLLASIDNLALESAQDKLKTLLLKDLLLQVDQQYKENLNKIDEIETHQTAITNQKIKEIFDYKNWLERKILELEKNLS